MNIVHGHGYQRPANSCLKVKPRTVFWLSSWICMLKQALANMETEGFYYVSEAGIFWYIVKHLLNSTLSNIRSVLLGQEMSGSASLRPTSLVP